MLEGMGGAYTQEAIVVSVIFWCLERHFVLELFHRNAIRQKMNSVLRKSLEETARVECSSG